MRPRRLAYPVKARDRVRAKPEGPESGARIRAGETL